MIDKRIEQLMWLEIDDAISADDHRWLWSHLDANPEDRAHFDQLCELSTLFSGAVEMDPPAELRTRIRRALQAASPEWMDTTPRPSLWTRIVASATPRPTLRLAGAVVAGVFIGIIGYHVVSYRSAARQPLDKNQFSATMGLRSVHDTDPVMEIDLPTANGTFAVGRDESSVRTRLEVTSETEIDVVIDYKGSALEFGGGNLADRSSNQVTVEDHGIRIRNRGEGTYFFVFQLSDDPTSPFVVRILEEDNVLFEKSVTPERSPKD
jgi:hypothetical protein